MSKPIERRELVTVEDIVTVYTTVTEGAVPTNPVDVNGQYAHSQFHTRSWSRTWSYVATTATVVSSSNVEPTETSTASTETPVSTSSSAEVQVITSSSSVAQVTTSSSITVIQSSSTSTTAAAATSSASSYETIVLNQHNIHRTNHSAVDIAWNETLAATALKIAQSCVYAHDTDTDGGGYGQNIGAGSPPSDVGSMITNMMYNGEIGYYPLPWGEDSPNMSNFEQWGHFSQIVWKDTTSIGCATYECSTLENVSSDVEPYFTVCNYYPAGNYQGEYSNVGAPLGDATVTV